MMEAPTVLEKKNSVLEPVCLEGVEFDSGTETWIGRHEAICRTVQKGDPELIFIGDSITHFWEKEGVDSWKEYFLQFSSVNMGFGGDRIQHVLWRLQNGELDGISPRLAVLMIGTNNSEDNTAEEIAEGIEELCGLIREKLPETKIILLAIFPRDTPEAPRRTVNERVNEIIAGLEDRESICFHETGGFLVDGDGVIKAELMADLLHPTAAGYAVWAEVLNPILFPLIEESRRKDQ